MNVVTNVNWNIAIKMKKQIDWNVGDLILISNGNFKHERCGIILEVLSEEITLCNIKIHWFNSGNGGFYRGNYHRFKKLNV